jgi:FtsZ-binding cell division protein ZapB
MVLSANNYATFSMGISAVAQAYAAISLGDGTTAKARGGMAVGANNDAVDNPSPTAAAATDRIFQVGNGSSDLTRSNALTVLRNGNIGLGITSPNAPLQFANTVANRKLVLYDVNNNDHQYSGIGINNDAVRYQVAGTTADHAFYVGTSSTTSTELLRIKGTGNVGIGNSNPLATLALNNGFGNKIALYTTSATQQYGFGVQSGLFQMYGDAPVADIAFGTGSSSSFTERMRIKGTGNVGIGTSTPSQALQVIGNIIASGTITPSDVRYKKNIEPIQMPLQKLQQLNGVTYNYKQEEFPAMKFPDITQVGLIAQDVEKVFPQLVFTDDKGYKAVDYVKLIPLLIESLKEEHQQHTEDIKRLEKMIAELKSSIQNKL